VLHADRREDGDLQLLGGEDVGCITLAAESSFNHCDVHLRRRSANSLRDRPCRTGSYWRPQLECWPLTLQAAWMVSQGSAHLLVCEVAQREAGEDLEVAQRGLLPANGRDGVAVEVRQRIEGGPSDGRRVHGDALRQRHHMRTAQGADTCLAQGYRHAKWQMTGVEQHAVDAVCAFQHLCRPRMVCTAGIALNSRR